VRIYDDEYPFGICYVAGTYIMLVKSLGTGPGTSIGLLVSWRYIELMMRSFFLCDTWFVEVLSSPSDYSI